GSLAVLANPRSLVEGSVNVANWSEWQSQGCRDLLDVALSSKGRVDCGMRPSQYYSGHGNIHADCRRSLLSNSKTESDDVFVGVSRSYREFPAARMYPDPN